MKMNEINIIIPALEKNKYSEYGDLVYFGETTLLEWKISQAKKVDGIKNIYVTSSSNLIKNLCKKNNVKFLRRKPKISLDKLHRLLGKKFKNEYLLWTNPTAPFFAGKDIYDFIIKFKKNSKKNDSAVTCLKEQEYFYYKNKSLNFDSSKNTVSRNKIKSLVKITGGAYLIKGSLAYQNGILLGKKPYFYYTNWLQSLELKTTKQIHLFNGLLENYLKQQ